MHCNLRRRAGRKLEFLSDIRCVQKLLHLIGLTERIIMLLNDGRRGAFRNSVVLNEGIGNAEYMRQLNNNSQSQILRITSVRWCDVKFHNHVKQQVITVSCMVIFVTLRTLVTGNWKDSELNSGLHSPNSICFVFVCEWFFWLVNRRYRVPSCGK